MTVDALTTPASPPPFFVPHCAAHSTNETDGTGHNRFKGKPGTAPAPQYIRDDSSKPQIQEVSSTDSSSSSSSKANTANGTRPAATRASSSVPPPRDIRMTTLCSSIAVSERCSRRRAVALRSRHGIALRINLSQHLTTYQ